MNTFERNDLSSQLYRWRGPPLYLTISNCPASSLARAFSSSACSSSPLSPPLCLLSGVPSPAAASTMTGFPSQSLAGTGGMPFTAGLSLYSNPTSPLLVPVSPLSPASPITVPTSTPAIAMQEANQIQSGEGGSVFPKHFSHEEESAWLELIPEFDGFGVRARKRLPAWHYIAEMRTRTHIAGHVKDEFAVKINDHCYHQGISLAEYEALEPNTLHILKCGQLVGGSNASSPTSVSLLNPRYPDLGFANCRLQFTPSGLLVQATADIEVNQSLSLYYGSQYWFGGRPFWNNPKGASASP